MNVGLSPTTYKQANVKMFSTYVRNISNGTEVGQVLALDLRGDSKIELTSKIFVIPQSIMIGDGKHVYYFFPNRRK
jgi:hypothetical protein